MTTDVDEVIAWGKKHPEALLAVVRAVGIPLLLNAARPTVRGVCAVCGATYSGMAYRRYCSGRCRKAAWVVRRAGTR